jgi:hypothetical protein
MQLGNFKKVFFTDKETGQMDTTFFPSSYAPYNYVASTYEGKGPMC